MGNDNIHPGKLFGLASGYWQPCALHAGVKLGIFTTLAGNNYSAPELAERLKASKRGMELLLNALAAMDLLEKRGEKYRCTLNTQKTKILTGIIGQSILDYNLPQAARTSLEKALAMLEEGEVTTGLKVLGTPIGSNAFAQDFLDKVTETLEKDCQECKSTM